MTLICYTLRFKMIPSNKKTSEYIPNHIPAVRRLKNIAFSIMLLAYGTFGVWNDDLYIPAKKTEGIHLHDLSAWAMYGSIVCACLVLLSIVVDHHDKRNNEVNYKLFNEIATKTGWFFFILSISMEIVHYRGGWAETPRLGLVFAIISVVALWMGRRISRQEKEENIKLEAWKESEIQKLNELTRSENGSKSSFFGKDATTVQVTFLEHRYENSLDGFEVKRILRNSTGDYFYWMWQSDSPLYLKQITQVNAKIILKKKYQKP